MDNPVLINLIIESLDVLFDRTETLDEAQLVYEARVQMTSLAALHTIHTQEKEK